MQHLIRNIIVESPSKVGNLGLVTSAIGAAEGDIGDIKLIKSGPLTTVRDISVTCRDEVHLETVIANIEAIGNGVEIHAVTDDVLKAHEGGKIAMKSTIDVRSLGDLQRVYTPGVASVCLEIEKHPEQAKYFTSIGKSVAIVTDGTAILGLGNIGSVAGMPVMEGKSVLLDQFVGLSGVPILLDTSDPDQVVETVKHIHQGFGAILLEDIGSPHCFEIEERLKAELPIPVMHDDQHGTAVVTLAAVLNACRATGVDPRKATVGQIGLGAAGLAIVRMLLAYGVKDVYGIDRQPAAIERLHNYGGKSKESLDELMNDCDIVIATTGVEGLIKPEMVRKGQIILALSNPNPEIQPAEAIKAGAAFAADGRSVNNVVGFPGIFRGALDAEAKQITYPMLIAAAEAIVSHTRRGELIPTPLDPALHLVVARAVEEAAAKEKHSQ